MAERNLLFNNVRDTSDHGCINYYDRVPYLTDMRSLLLRAATIIPVRRRRRRGITCWLACLLA